MLPQERIIERIRERCRADERLLAALMYGSFALGQGDRWSDVEFWLFFDDEALPTVDPSRWIAGVAPAKLLYQNEYGTTTALLDDWVRLELHFESIDRIAVVETWDSFWLPSLDAAVALDRNGALSRRLRRFVRPPPAHDTPEEARFLVANLVNWSVMGANILDRGDDARAHAFLSYLHDHLLRAVRVLEGRTGSWLTPQRGLREDLPPELYERFRTCTAPLHPASLRAAYAATWAWSHELIDGLAARSAV